MSIRTLAAAAALVATAGSADAQVMYSGGNYYRTSPGFYGGGYNPAPLYSAGYVAPGVFNNNFNARPLYNSASYAGYPNNTGLYTSYPYTSFFNRGFNTGLYGTGYTGLYNSSLYTPGYVGGSNTFSGRYLPRAGVYNGFRMRR